MNTVRRTILSVLLALPAARLHAATTNRVGAGSVLEVIVHYQTFDPVRPWQKKRPGVRSGYGVVVDRGKVLTTEDLVRNHTLVELRSAKSGAKIPADVEQLDWQGNLALLVPAPGSSAAATTPAPLAPTPKKDEAVRIVQFDGTGDIQEGAATVVRMAVEGLPSAASSMLTLSVLTDLSVNGRGAAVFAGDALAGLVMTYDSSRRMAKVLPAPIISRFLRDVQDAPYRGFATAGFVWTSLVDPTKRAYLNVPGRERGVMVVSTVPRTGAAETLKARDVVVEWAGHAVDNQGFYEDAELGRMQFVHLIKGLSFPGDIVPARVYRDGQVHDVNVRLMRAVDEDRLIPENIAGRRPEYLVEGGLVIRELTGDYLREYGGRWRLQLPRLAHIYSTRARQPEESGDRVVILSHVLPDPVNIGYQQFGRRVIEQINGTPVRCMADVFRVVDRDGGLARLQLAGLGVELALDPALLPRANRRLAERYGIAALRFQIKGGLKTRPSTAHRSAPASSGR